MKILFFISVHGHGRGGHFHSLNHISRKIGLENDVRIVSFGPGKSDIIESNPYFLRHIYFNGINLLSLKQTIKKISKSFHPDVYHCFDIGSYNVVRLFIPSNKEIIVINKCGGPNPKDFPHIKNIILFSKENQEWFLKQNKFKDANIHLIPNRVKPIKLNPNYCPLKMDTNSFLFIRICRIGSFYKKSIEDSIELISKLVVRNIMNIKLFIIGVIEDNQIFNKISENKMVKDGFVILLTEPAFTNEASRMLYLANAVIGSGRGLMEAASLGKPILAIDKNGDVPVLLNDNYFKDAFYTNFSERNTFCNLNSEENLNRIIRLIEDKNYYSKISHFALNSFDNYFSIDKVSDAYLSVYKNAIMGKRKLLKDSSMIMKSIISFYRSSIKSK